MWSKFENLLELALFSFDLRDVSVPKKLFTQQNKTERNSNILRRSKKREKRVHRKKCWTKRKTVRDTLWMHTTKCQWLSSTVVFEHGVCQISDWIIQLGLSDFEDRFFKNQNSCIESPRSLKKRETQLSNLCFFVQKRETQFKNNTKRVWSVELFHLHDVRFCVILNCLCNPFTCVFVLAYVINLCEI